MLLTSKRHRVVKTADWMTAAQIRMEVGSDPRWVAPTVEAVHASPDDDPSNPSGAAAEKAAVLAADADVRLQAARTAAVDAVRAAEDATETAYRAVIEAQLLAAEIDEARGTEKIRRKQGSVARSAARYRGDIMHGVADEIRYLLTRKPRTVLKTLAISFVSGMAYLVWIRLFNWDKYQPWLPFLAVLVISTIMGGSACVNAMAFDAARVRASLDSGIRPWQIIVVKNIALAVIVFPVGLVMSIGLAWNSGKPWAMFAAILAVITLLFLWSGVGNVLSVTVPVRDVSLKRHWKEHTLKTFVVAFGIAWVIGYGVNAILLWRYLAARELAERWGSPLLAGLYFVAGGVLIWILLTVLAVAIGNQTDFSQRLRLQLLMSQPTTSSVSPKEPVPAAAG